MSDNLYLRYQGRVSGPFPFSKIQEMLKRGQISRLHQISPDRAAWTRVMENEVLVPPPPPVAEVVMQPQREEVAPAAAEPAARALADEGEDVLEGGTMSTKISKGLKSSAKHRLRHDDSGESAMIWGVIGATIMLLGIIGMAITHRYDTWLNVSACVIQFMLLVAAAMLGGMLKSKSRGIALLAVVGFGVLLSGLGLLLVFPCMALLHGNLAHRMASPKREASRNFGIVASAVNLFIFIMIGLAFIFVWASVMDRMRDAVEFMGATCSIMLVSIPALCGLLGSAFALADAAKGGIRGLRIAAYVLFSCALVLFTGGVAIFVIAGSNPLADTVWRIHEYGKISDMVGLAAAAIFVITFYFSQLALLRLGLISLLRGTEPTQEELAAAQVEQEVPAATSTHQPSERSRLTAAIYCRGCGREIHATALTCPHCGAPQKAAE